MKLAYVRARYGIPYRCSPSQGFPHHLSALVQEGGRSLIPLFYPLVSLNDSRSVSSHNYGTSPSPLLTSAIPSPTPFNNVGGLRYFAFAWRGLSHRQSQCSPRPILGHGESVSLTITANLLLLFVSLLFVNLLLGGTLAVYAFLLFIWSFL